VTELPTRRQLREAERSGHAITRIAPNSAEADPDSKVLNRHETLDESISDSVKTEPQVFISRKKRREAEARGEVIADSPASSVHGMEPVEVTQDALSDELSDVQIPEVEIPSIDFKGTNLFSEPSTQSIVLDVAPEAISLPIETGEIIITGSILVLTDTASNTITDSLDGMALDNADRQDAVTGIISIVEPISALELISARLDVGVVPKAVLRKGWWRKWALAVIALGMVIAAFIATITIMNLV
jgi:hypothetical protein